MLGGGEEGPQSAAHAIKHTTFTAEQLCVPILGELSIPGMSFRLAYFCRQTKMFCKDLTRKQREKQLLVYCCYSEQAQQTVVSPAPGQRPDRSSDISCSVSITKLQHWC